jgi:hypothetical protein
LFFYVDDGKPQQLDRGGVGREVVAGLGDLRCPVVGSSVGGTLAA